MKLQAEIGDVRSQVEVRRDGGKLFAKVDDRDYELEVSEPEPGVFLFKHNGRIYEASVSEPTTAGDAPRVRIGTNEFVVRVVDPKRLRSVGGGSEHPDGIAEIRSAMPGKVVRILVNTGANVTKGDGVVVVEAMKMQNELKAPKDGIVKEIRATVDATVAAGDILVTIE